LDFDSRSKSQEKGALPGKHRGEGKVSIKSNLFVKNGLVGRGTNMGMFSICVKKRGNHAIELGDKVGTTERHTLFCEGGEG